MNKPLRILGIDPGSRITGFGIIDVVGQGKAAKEQVQDMVVRMLGLSGTPQADAADGLAVALTHALRNQGLAARLNPDGLQVKRGRFQ